MSTIGNQNKQQIGEHSFAIQTQDLPVGAVVKRLHLYTPGATYSVFRNSDGTAYQVPAGKVLEMYATEFMDNGNIAVINLLYGSTSSNVGGGAPTSPIYYGSGTSSSAPCIYTSPATKSHRSLFFKIPENMYPHFQSTSAGANVFFSVLAIERAA